MKDSIRILFVEDVETDAEMIWNEIRRSKIDFSKKLVDNREDYISALKSFNPELIISDYSLPQFDGMSALNIKNEVLPDIPFILVTGSINEEIAVEVMKVGADDYVIKQNMTRLGAAIRAALIKRKLFIEKVDAEKKLKESQELINSFINTARDIMFVKDDQLRYIIINEETLKFFGRSRDEIMYKTDFALVDKESAESCAKSDRATLEKKEVTIAEEVINGRIYETTKFPLKLKGDQIMIGAIIREITEQKHAEEALKQKIEELEQFNELTVGREMKMIKLKIEVNSLLVKMGEKEKYKIVE